MRSLHTAIAIALLGALALSGCETDAEAQTTGASVGASRGSTNGARVFACKPTVSSVSASSGTEAGGTSVTVTGTCFTAAMSVTFGGVSGTSLSISGWSTLTVTTPAYTSALSSTAADNDVTVAVTGPGGTGSLSAGYRYTSEPKRIAGSSYVSEWRANDPRITLNSGNVSNWPDYAGTNALSQGTASQQPALEAAGWNGGPSFLGDGADDRLSNAAISGVASGHRPYIFVVAQRVSGSNKNFFYFDDATASWVILSDNGANFQLTRADSSGGSAVTSGAAVDANRHLFEAGLTAGGTNALVIDGSGSNNARTGTNSNAMSRLSMFAHVSATNFANYRIVAALLLLDEPNAQTKSDLRAAYKSTIRWSGYTGNSLGLP